MKGDTSTRWQRWWSSASLPLKVGILFGLLGAALAVAGLVRNASAPFSWRGLAMAVVLAGGSWGVVSWAIATAIVEVARDRDSGEET